jgi:glycosyltransferase involved in cell wall biosynthesis
VVTRAPIRVLALIKGLGRGGAERLVVDLVRSAERACTEYEVAYVLPAKSALVPDLDVPVHCLGEGRAPWPVALAALIRRRRFEVVHLHSPSLAPATRVPNRGPVHVYTEHNVWDRYHPLTRIGNAMTWSANAHVFAVSDRVARSIGNGVSRRRRMPPIETLHHGVAPDFGVDVATRDAVRAEFAAPSTPLIVTVANFKPSKGHQHLLAAIPRVLRHHPDARFVLAGVGPLESEARATVDRLGIGSAVTFAGFRDDAPALIAAADLFVLPSEHEGLPIALVEALALGTASVVTSAGGIPEVVTHGREALIVPPKDPVALADGIVRLATDGAARRSMAEAARERAKAFDIRLAAARIEQVYRELTA